MQREHPKELPITTHTYACASASFSITRCMCRTSYSCAVTFHTAILPHLSTINMSLQPWDSTTLSPQDIIVAWNHLSDGNQVKPCPKSSEKLFAFHRQWNHFGACSGQEQPILRGRDRLTDQGYSFHNHRYPTMVANSVVNIAKWFPVFPKTIAPTIQMGKVYCRKFEVISKKLHCYIHHFKAAWLRQLNHLILKMQSIHWQYCYIRCQCLEFWNTEWAHSWLASFQKWMLWWLSSKLLYRKHITICFVFKCYLGLSLFIDQSFIAISAYGFPHNIAEMIGNCV